ELELIDAREEVASVRNVGRDVVLGARIKVRFSAIDRRRYALVLRAQRPPCLVVVSGFGFAGKDLPAPLVENKAERQKSNFVERRTQLQRNVGFSGWFGVDELETLQICRCDGQRDGVADRFMETIVRSVAKEHRLLVVGALIEVVAEFVVHG